MSNPNNPFGIRPLGTTLAGVPLGLSQYAKPSSDVNAIFCYDLVVKVAAAVPDPTNPNVNIPAIKTGYQGTPGTTLWQGVSLNYGAVSTATIHSVIDQVDALYIAQCDGATSISTASHVGKNANVSLSQAGSATTQQSGMQVSSASIAGTAGLDFRIYEIYGLISNAEGANAIVEIVILKHELGQGTAGV